MIVNLFKVDTHDWQSLPNCVYIGGSVWIKGVRYPRSKWNLPRYIYDKKMPYIEMCIEYEEYVRATLIDDINELSGKFLGYWCTNGVGRCHGNVLLKLLDQNTFPSDSDPIVPNVPKICKYGSIGEK